MGVGPVAEDDWRVITAAIEDADRAEIEIEIEKLEGFRLGGERLQQNQILERTLRHSSAGRNCGGDGRAEVVLVVKK